MIKIRQTKIGWMFVNNNLSVSPPWPRTEEGQKSYLIIWKQYLPSWEDCSQWGFIFTINIQKLDNNKYPGLVLSSLCFCSERLMLIVRNCDCWVITWLGSTLLITSVKSLWKLSPSGPLLPVSSPLKMPLDCWILREAWNKGKLFLTSAGSSLSQCLST